MSCAVHYRRREMGIRMAVGATARDVVRLVLGEASRLVIGGIVVGVVLTLAAGQWLRSVLYGIAPHDPAVFLIVPLLLVAVAVTAAWRPARQAGRVETASALHEE